MSVDEMSCYRSVLERGLPETDLAVIIKNKSIASKPQDRAETANSEPRKEKRIEHKGESQ